MSYPKMEEIADAVTKLAEDGRRLKERVDSLIERRDAIDSAKVRALYERAGTPGEKAAALEALKRMGVDPTTEAPPKKAKEAPGETGNPYPKYSSEWVKWKHAHK